MALVFVALAVPLAPGRASAAAGAATSLPRLVAVRAMHLPGHDRVVFDFAGQAPEHWTIRYVRRVVADPRGTVVPIAGRAILAVVFRSAVGHTETGRATAPGRLAFALPNVMTVIRTGDFEGVLSYGIGVAKRTKFRVFTLSRPNRVVIDVATAFRTVPLRVYFFNSARFSANTPPFVSAVRRAVAPATPATALMDRLFAGVTTAEQAGGLRFLASGATGFSSLSINAGVARIRLTGRCTSGGSTATIAEEISTTLKQLPGVHWVKIYDAAGRTEQPFGLQDSIPTCLEP